MKGLYGGRQPSNEPNPYTAVFVVLSNRFRYHIVQVERESVVQSGWQDCGSNLCDKLAYGLNFVRDLNSCEVDVGGWSTQLVGRKQYASLKYELTSVLGVGKAKQETFECIQSQILGKGTTFVPCSPPQRQECSPSNSRLGRFWNRFPPIRVVVVSCPGPVAELSGQDLKRV